MSEEKSTPARTKVTFYTKNGCHLCEEARELLDEVAAQVTYELTEVDIRSNLRTYEQYRYRVPVIIINETIVVEGRIEYNDLANAFQLKKTAIDDEKT